ncbi:agmatine/peptidylarginine deiminase [Methylococcus sp. EFPC2]|uniref:agmatine deiminase family protein n=1 Tax=Methylococcus sp. EFPC2 TaxID=2812648 RepID=UPI001F078DA3|nr:agmatine deiminase family protein [Methylococcus sp. EFPC2]
MSNPLHFPPEWAPQSAVLIAWPYDKGDFQRWLAEVEDTYALIGSAVSLRQTLIVAVQNNQHRLHVLECLTKQGADLTRVIPVELPYNDVWVRDTAPLTVDTPAGAKLLDFRFNGWGGKYECADDARLARRLHESGVFGATPLEAVDFVLEGGSLETDGEGTLLTTARCLLNPNRNPSFDQSGIERQLQEAFGLQRVLWLHHGYAEGDDTDAHVDTLARFCAVDTIAYTACDDPEDDLYGDLKAMEDELKRLVATSGGPYRLVPLPVPKPIYSEEGDRLPATYANFLIINGAVLVPVYGDPADDIALTRLKECFPDRELVSIPSTPLIRQYGSIHCMTMQFPVTVSISGQP